MRIKSRLALVASIVVLTAPTAASPPSTAAAAAAASPPTNYETVSSRSPETIAVHAAGTWRVTLASASTKVNRNNRSVAWSVVVPDRFGLPLVTSRGLRGGTSGDGSALVLATPPHQVGTSWRTEFAVVTKDRIRRIDLAGQWAFDAISPDGRSVFMTESVGPGKYWVRLVDVVTGVAGRTIVAKTIAAEPTNAEEEGPMEGLPLDRVTSADGQMVFTLYDGPEHPFIHGLNVVQGSAICYDLPMNMKAQVSDLRLRRATEVGHIDVLRGTKAIAQIADTTALGGPAVRIATATSPVR